MKEAIREFLNSKRIAVVGVSREPKKFGNSIYRGLKERGYEVIGVNPCLKDLNGEACYPNISALRGKIDGIVICISPEKVEPVLREAARSGMMNVWLQQGSETVESATLGKLLGLNVVAGKCILMYAQPVNGFHNIHRFFMKIFGKL
ncbi:MAG TPA: CoA-binding protein [Candidatus Kryptonia bacterium]